MGSDPVRIAILIEPSLRSHVGVWTAIQALQHQLSKLGRVDLVHAQSSSDGTRRWFRLIDPAHGCPEVHCPFSEVSFSGTAVDVKKQYRQKRKSLKQAITGNPFHQSEIGTRPGREEYDVAILGAPWMVDWTEAFPARQVIGMVYDVIPNELALVSREPVLARFATQHSIGYRYYDRCCHQVWAISPDSTQAYNRYFCRDGEAAICMPPIVPAIYDQEIECPEARQRVIALAAPFDLRKGLVELPSLIAELPKLDRILIYGSPRCSKKQLYAFFDALDQRLVTWWPRASAKQLISIFQQARLLLFPSHQEGLGLPIIEAQLCGCPVLVRDKEPMRSLVMPGCPKLPAETAPSSAARLMFDSFEAKNGQVQQWAMQEFNPRNLLQFLVRQLGLEPAGLKSSEAKSDQITACSITTTNRVA